MRVTNSMMTGRMTLNMHRNMRNLNTLNNQLSSTKRISVPSDDPISAARALKFRTSVSETEQYQRNVSQGLSWMSATDRALINVNSIFTRVRGELAVQGANGTLVYKDRAAIATNISQLIEQMGKEMNATYAGRYVFSGYRTDKPPVIQRDNDKTYHIIQRFQGTDVENAMSAIVKKDHATAGNTEPNVVEKDVSIIKLAYTGTGVPVLSFNANWSSPLTVVSKSNATDLDAYKPTAGTVNFIQETGELVLSTKVADDIKTQQLNVWYSKTGFKEGDLNPELYFTCDDYDVMAGKVIKSYNMDGQVLEYEFGVNTRIQVNTLAKDVFTDKLYGDLKVFLDLLKNVRVSNEDQLKERMKLPPHNLTNADDIKKAVDEQITQETQELEAMLFDRFNTIMGKMDKHFHQVSTMQTDLGTRMDRLKLIMERLDDDFTNYSELLSENEDTNMAIAGIEMSMAKLAYEASLKVGANIIQLTLADYIR